MKTKNPQQKIGSLQLPLLPQLKCQPINLHPLQLSLNRKQKIKPRVKPRVNLKVNLKVNPKVNPKVKPRINLKINLSQLII